MLPALAKSSAMSETTTQRSRHEEETKPSATAATTAETTKEHSQDTEHGREETIPATAADLTQQLKKALNLET